MNEARAIAITGADGQVGTMLRARLVDDLVEQLPLGSRDNWRPAISSAHAVAHLAGTLQPRGSNTYEKANVETARRVVDAATGASVERIVYLSYVGASLDADNEYLRTKAEAERILLDSGIPTIVLRCVHVYGPPGSPGPTARAFTQRGRGPVRVPGSGRQRIAPLYIGDVVEVVRAALLAGDPPAGVFDLAGPDEMSMDEFVRALNGPDARISHLPAGIARVVAHVAPSLTPALIDLLLVDNVLSGEHPEAAATFGVERHRLADVWDPQAPAAG